MSQSFAFIICTERGLIEKQSVLLAVSIRLFGGCFSSVPVYSFCPRKGFEPGKQTLNLFEKLGVSHKNIPLNTRFRDYPLANKPLVCTYAEETLTEDILIFLDSDKILINEPSYFNTIKPGTVFARPVDKIGIGSPPEQLSDFWTRLYQEFGLTVNRTVQTTIDRAEIVPYFNSGMVVVNKKDKIFSTWLNTFLYAYENSILPQKGIYYLEQSTFAISVLRSASQFVLLPESYNIPVHDQKFVLDLDTKQENLVTVHYHRRLFNKENELTLTDLLKNTHFKFKTLDKYISFIMKEKFYFYPNRFGLF